MAEKSENLLEEYRNLVTLLEKFRITFKDVILIKDAQQQANISTKNEFEKLLCHLSYYNKKSEIGLKDKVTSISSILKLKKDKAERSFLQCDDNLRI